MKPEQEPKGSEEQTIQLAKEDSGIPLLEEQQEPHAPATAAGGNLPPNTPPTNVTTGGGDEDENHGSSFGGVPNSEDAGETVLTGPLFEIGAEEQVAEPAQAVAAVMETAEPRASRRENVFTGVLSGVTGVAALVGIGFVILNMTGSHHF